MWGRNKIRKVVYLIKVIEADKKNELHKKILKIIARNMIFQKQNQKLNKNSNNNWKSRNN